MPNFFLIPDKEKDYQRYMVYALGILWPVVIAAIVSVGFFFFPQIWQRWLTFLGVSFFVFILNFTLNQLGYTRLASVLLTSLIWLFITIPTYSAGGIRAPGILMQTSVVFTAGLLLGWRGGLAIGLLTIGADFWLVYLEVNGNLPIPSVMHTPITLWISAIIPFGTILAIQYYATNHLRAGLIALQREIKRREEAEKITNQTMYNLQERVKELKTLHGVSSILQHEDVPLKKIFQEIAEILPPGWQYPDITAARICFAGSEYTTGYYKASEYCQRAEVKTQKGNSLSIEVVYLKQMPELDEGPFLKEERNLINILAEMVKTHLNRREHRDELKDYKYALDIGYMVSISGVDTRFTYVNDNFCKSSKYDPTELLGKDYNAITSDLHSPEYFKELNISLQDGKPFRGEFCNKAKDGTLYWVDTTIVPFLDGGGKISQYLTINHDITERKAAEEKTREREAELSAFFENIEGAASLLDVNKRYLLFNRRFIDDHRLLSNYDPYVGQEIYDFLPDDLKKARYKMLDKVLRGTKEVIEVDYVRNGARVFYRSSFFPVITDGKVTGISQYSIDLTKSKEAELRIKESEERYRSLFENSGEAILLSKPSGEILTANPAACKMFGRTEEELRNVGRDEIINLKDPRLEHSLKERERTGYFKGELTFVRKDGTVFPTEINSTVFTDSNGKKKTAIFILDITERKRMESELQKSEVWHRALVESVNDAITVVNEQKQIIYRSPSVERINGYTLNEAKEKSLLFLTHPDDKERVAAYINKVFETPGLVLIEQFRLLHKKGHYIWIETTLTNLLHLESVKGVVNNYRDITERKEAEDKIKQSEQLLKKITSQIPGNTYMFEIEKNGMNNILFMSRGNDAINHQFDFRELSENPNRLNEIVLPDDKVKFNTAMKEAYKTQLSLSIQYRALMDGTVRWRWLQAIPEKDMNGRVMWYGVASDITPLVDYITSIEQIIFDIGHVIRRPVSSMLGMTKLINEYELSDKEIKEISKKLHLITEEMDKFITELNQAYQQKKQNTQLNMDISSAIDKRSSLFG